MQLNNKKAFTIVELMIAMTVFSVAILLVTSAVIFIGKQYQKGVNQAQLEDAARTIHQNISDAIKFSGAGYQDFTPYTGADGYGYICVGNATYYYPSGAYSGINDVLSYNSIASNLKVKYTSDCNDNSSGATNLLPDKAKVTKFAVENENGVWKITTNFIIADEDLADLPSIGGIIKCKSGVAGREFCAQSDITSYASGRTN